MTATMTDPTTDRAALLRAICQHPDEDTPRLVYADWLDENGTQWDRGRAAFIRAQIALYRTTVPKCDKVGGSDDSGAGVNEPAFCCRCRWCRLRAASVTRAGRLA